MVFSFIPFISFILVNILVIAVSRKSFGRTLPLTFMLTVIVLYISGLLFNSFTLGYIINIVLAVLGILVFVYKILIKKDKGLLKHILTKGFIAYIIIFIFLLIIDIGSQYVLWDEYMHWGKMVKEMLRLNTFYCDNASTLLAHKKYPPFIQLFEMFWCKFSLGYSESVSLLAIHILELVLFLFAIIDDEGIKKGKLKYDILGLIFKIYFVVFIILLFDVSGIFNSIYIDLLMPIMFVYALSLLIRKDERYSNFTYISLVITAISSVMLKETCVAYVMLICLVYVCFVIMDKPFLLVEAITRTIGLIGLPVANFFVWTRYVSRFEINPANELSLNSVNLKDLIQIIVSGGDGDRGQVYKDFINAMISVDLSCGIIKLPYVQLVILSFALLVILYYFYYDFMSKKEAVIYTVIFTCGSIGYALMMLIVYVFSFFDAGLVSLDSYDRYMSSYITSHYLILVVLIFELIRRKNEKKNSILKMVLAAITITICLPFGIKKILPKYDPVRQKTSYESIAENITDKTEDGSRIFIISDNNTALSTFLGYYLDNRWIDDSNIYDAPTYEPSEEKWQDYYNNMLLSQYVYVAAESEIVSNRMDIICDLPTESNTLYRVNADSKTLSRVY